MTQESHNRYAQKVVELLQKKAETFMAENVQLEARLLIYQEDLAAEKAAVSSKEQRFSQQASQQQSRLLKEKEDWERIKAQLKGEIAGLVDKMQRERETIAKPLREEIEALKTELSEARAEIAGLKAKKSRRKKPLQKVA